MQTKQTGNWHSWGHYTINCPKKIKTYSILSLLSPLHVFITVHPCLVTFFFDYLKALFREDNATMTKRTAFIPRSNTPDLQRRSRRSLMWHGVVGNFLLALTFSTPALYTAQNTLGCLTFQLHRYPWVLQHHCTTIWGVGSEKVARGHCLLKTNCHCSVMTILKSGHNWTGNASACWSHLRHWCTRTWLCSDHYSNYVYTRGRGWCAYLTEVRKIFFHSRVPVTNRNFPLLRFWRTS